MTITCLPCKKSFRSSQDLHKHLRSTVHGNGLNCDDCQRANSLPWDETAFLAHINSKSHLFYCNDCNKSFKAKSDLKQHMKTAPIHVIPPAQPTGNNESSASRPSNPIAPRVYSTEIAIHSGPSRSGTYLPPIVRDESQESQPSEPVASRAYLPGKAFHPPSTSKPSNSLPPIKQPFAKSAGKQPAPNLKTPTPPRLASAGTKLSWREKEARRVGSGEAPPIQEIKPDSKPYVQPEVSRPLPMTKSVANKSKDELPTLSFRAPSVSSANKATINKPNQQVAASSSQASVIPCFPLPLASVSNTEVANFPWSNIHVSHRPEALEELIKHCHSPEVLGKFQYRLSPYTDLEIDGFLKCEKCGKKKKETRALRSAQCFYHPQKKKWKRPYRCCNQTGKGCLTNPSHIFRPSPSDTKYHSFSSCPASPTSSSASKKFPAIVLDCEMAGDTFNNSEVILICAADYLTSRILLNRYVLPSTQITDWRSQIHGIKSSVVLKAVEDGEALLGWEAVRVELWKLIDHNTILIGHALHYDLAALRIIHTRVVDSAILAKNAVNLGRRQFGLDILFKTFLHQQIRDNEKGIHSCEEDVWATREVVLWCMKNEKQFADWAEGVRELERRKMDVLGERRSGAGKAGRRRYDYDEGDEILRWEDIAVDLGWPHPDTGYDPWSD